MCYNFIRVFLCYLFRTLTNIEYRKHEKKQNFWLVIDFHSFYHLNVSPYIENYFPFSFFFFFSLLFTFVLYRWLLFTSVARSSYSMYTMCEKKREYSNSTEWIDVRLRLNGKSLLISLVCLWIQSKFSSFFYTYVMVELYCSQSTVAILGFNRSPFNKNS